MTRQPQQDREGHSPARCAISARGPGRRRGCSPGSPSAHKDAALRGRGGGDPRARRGDHRRQCAGHGVGARAQPVEGDARSAAARRQARGGHGAQHREVIALPDPVGQVIAEWTRPNGLVIPRVRVPLGVIGIIYESRPNVTADAGALCLKSGNAVILRGGSESFRSSTAIHRCLRRACGRPACPRTRSRWCRPRIARPSAICSRTCRSSST